MILLAYLCNTREAFNVEREVMYTGDPPYFISTEKFRNKRRGLKRHAKIWTTSDWPIRDGQTIANEILFSNELSHANSL